MQSSKHEERVQAPSIVTGSCVVILALSQSWVAIGVFPATKTGTRGLCVRFPFAFFNGVIIVRHILSRALADKCRMGTSSDRIIRASVHLIHSKQTFWQTSRRSPSMKYFERAFRCTSRQFPRCSKVDLCKLRNTG